ncbi:Hypothetical protein R9X50_00201900 [Acrodontium crateriforme]|uniref:FAD-binding PCMH-type domain-containing protein n=1 Tax=Acrodontium crateriforme TaxID=150365 RepID=A0AAQ3M062_9PEZI|nr:Hypothetical protein R9X50_00201900 [Acrodontium crateriforme]
MRSGGHAPFQSSASIVEGVTIDLQSLNQVTVSADTKTVNIGPGNRWGDVYARLAPQGLATSGGRVASVGVGGLVLGGGVSYFSAQKGFVCDTVKRFEIVLPSGRIGNATQSSHHDLWLALKGGSNNFGIVTAIEQEAFELSDFWGGSIGGDESTFPAQFAAFEAFTGNSDYDPNAALINSHTYVVSTNSWLAVNAIEYTKPEPTIITTKAAGKGGNSLGLDGSEGNVFNFLLSASWSLASDSDLMDKAVKKIINAAKIKAEGLGLYKKYIYLNYAAEWQDPIDGYGASVKARLQSVGRKYDPLGIFHKQVPGGFKLFN